MTDGTKISKIGPRLQDADAYVLDASGRTVSSGFVGLHAHLRVCPTDEFGIQAEMSCFPFGVTAAADAGRTQGERNIMDSFMLKNVLFVNVGFRDNCADLDRLEQDIHRFGDKVIGTKVYFDTGISQVSDITPLRLVCAFSQKRNLRVTVHCSNAPVPMAEILSVLHRGDLLTHAFHDGRSNASEDSFAAMKAAQKRGGVINAGFAGHVHADFAIFKQAIEVGVFPDTISTDVTKFSAYTRGGRYGMTMCMSLARLMGMTEEKIFRAVTSYPASVLGKSHEWGHLRVGGIADIAVLEYTDEGFSMTDKAGNHIESREGYRCALTVSDGQIVYKH